MNLETLTSLAILDIIKDYVIGPLFAILLSAVGFHIKADRDARKQHQEDIKNIHERINEEHLRVEDKYVRKETLLSAIEQIKTVAEDVKYIRRETDKYNEK